jgi:hypothetical protein
MSRHRFHRLVSSPARTLPSSGRARLSVACALLLAAALAIAPARAGNPRLVNSVSGPVTWDDRLAFFSTDLGPLGILDNAAAARMVRDGFTAWAAIPSVLITIEDRGPILLDGAPVDVTLDNFPRVLFKPDGQSPVVFDHDGRIMDALGVGDFAGFSFVEFLSSDLQHYREMAILLDGRDIDSDGPFTSVGWPGLVIHEEGHHLGLAHSVVNAQAYFFNDPILGLPPPPASSLETMYPFLLVSQDFQSTPHKDDVSILSLLYPAATFAPSTGSIHGAIMMSDLQTPLRGANVTARNLADPYDDAVSSISGANDFFIDSPAPVTGRYAIDGLTPGAACSVAISSIDHGGFSSPITTPLPGPDEFFNGAGESNDPDRDVPTDLAPITTSAGSSLTGVDVAINGPASSRILFDPSAAQPPDDAAVSGFPVPAPIDIRRVEARFHDINGDGGQETLTVFIDVVGPLGAHNSAFRFQLDFGEAQKIRGGLLSLANQTVEPGTRGVATADVTLEVAFTHAGPVFSGLPGLAATSSVDLAAGRVVFVASVEEIIAAATQDQIDAANNFDGTYTLLGFTHARANGRTDRVPDTDDNDNPSIVQEVSRYTFSPFPIRPTHLGSVPNGTLIGVEESTARAIRIGSTGFNSFSDLAMSADRRLFGSLGFDGNGGIVEINPGSARSRFVGSSGYSSVPALDFAPPGTPFAGTLFGTGAVGADSNYFLIRIDPVTGAGTPVGGPIGVPFVDAIVFTDDGRLLGTGFVAGQAVLAEIDPATGAGRVIGPTGFKAVAGLEVAGDGSLLGSLGGVDLRAGGIVRIDPATGAGTFIGFTGFSPVSGLTKLP